ncbi:MAG: hypothetical protein ACRDSF_00135 [Pseudonocardiaceae bacterium]
MNIGELIAHIKVEHRDALKNIATTHQAFKGLESAGKVALFPAGIAAAIPLLLSSVDAAWQLSGALGAIPAVAGTAGLVMGTLAVATMGFGNAMKDIGDPKKFAERIKFMAPAMQDAMISIQKLVPVWDTLKKRVQETFWTSLNTHIDLLGSKYLPILNTGMFKTALGMNRGTAAAAQFLETSSATDDVAHSFDNMSVFVEKVARTFPSLIALLLDFVSVGSDKLPAMGDGIESLVEKFTKFIDKARESGQLSNWIQRGLDSVKMLGQIFFNTGLIINEVLNTTQEGGGGLLSTLLRLTDQTLAWLKSAEGKERMQEVFVTVSAFASALLDVLPMVTGVLTTLMSVFEALPGPIQSVVASSIVWGGIIGLLTAKLAPLISLLLNFKFSMISTSATFIASWVSMAAATIAQGAVMIASLTATAAKYVAQWTIMAAGAMSRAVIMAAAWFVALGPIGWVIGAIVALVALVIWKWDEIVAFTKKAWEWCGNIIGNVVDWIKRKVAEGVAWVMQKWEELKALPGKALSWFGAMKDAAIGKVQELINWFTGLPGRLWDALGDLWNKMFEAGRRIIQRIVDGIKSMFSAVGDAIGGVASRIRGALPFSPAKWGPLSGSGNPEIAGARIGQMIAAGIRSSNGGIERAMAEITSRIMPQISAQIPAGALEGINIREGVFEGITEALRGIRLEILGDGTARLVNTTNLAQQRRL